MRSSLILLTLTALPTGVAPRSPRADDVPFSIARNYEIIRGQRSECVRRYAEALLRIVEECARLGFKTEGEAILRKLEQLYRPRSRASERQPRVEALEKSWRARAAAAHVALARERFKSDSVRAAAVKTIEEKEERALSDFVRELSRLANRCVREGFPAHGYEVVLWTVQFDPENPRLRKALRQRRWGDERSGEIRWYAPFDYAQAASGKIDHPTFGWVTPGELERLEAGEAKFNGQWMPKKKVEALRQKWSGRWKYITEHFVIHTNSSLEDAVAFGRRIEQLYSFVYRVWVDFYAFDDPRLAAKLVLGGGMDLGRRRLRLHYHRSRESYLWELQNDTLLRAATDRDLTTESAGFYWGQNGRAYFYRGRDGPDFRTVFHEVTHQIFGETYPIGARPPTWLVEGIAVFMERPVLRGARGVKRFLAGAEPPAGVKSKRGPRAARRAQEGDVLNIDEFMRNLRTNERFHAGDRHDHYATAGAIVHFFLLYRGGIHRRPFVRYAREAYRNDVEESPTALRTLYEYLGVGEEALQAEWEAFNERPDVFDF